MSEPQDRVELSLLGQLLSITGSHILPLLLVMMLFANSLLMALHIRAMNATIANAITTAASVAATAAAEVRVGQGERQREHSDIQNLMQRLTTDQSAYYTRAITDQNMHFDLLIKEKSIADTISHARLERVITRSCHAREKDFSRLFQPYAQGAQQP